VRTCALWCRTHLHRGALGQCLETCLGRRHGRALAALERVRGRAVPVLEAAAQVPRLSAEARGTVRCCLRVLCLGCGPCPYPCLCLRRFLCCLPVCLVLGDTAVDGGGRCQIWSSFWAPLGSAACRLSVWGLKNFPLGFQNWRHVRISGHVPITVPPLQFRLQRWGPFLPLFGPIQWW
jgi:hypothetical protein